MQLWQESFGDTEEFVDGFFCTAFSPARCRCVTIDSKVVAALYWMDVAYEGQRFAYLYSVAVEEKHRGKGLCAALMADTHALLKEQGYAGAILVPSEDSLFDFYAAMGYQTICCTDTLRCTPAATPTPALCPAATRRPLLLHS